MRELQFLCLAVSRRESGNCIAGIDLDSSRWIRPVNPNTQAALSDSQILVENGATGSFQILKPLDVVRITVEEPAGKCGQPENWNLVGGKHAVPFLFIRRLEEDGPTVDRIRRLAHTSDQSGQMFGSDLSSIPHQVIVDNPPANSLCVVTPKNLSWHRERNFRGNPCIKAHFDLGGKNVRHVLSVTDIIWEARLLKDTRESSIIYNDETPEARNGMDTLLTISLSDVFIKTNEHYKLIAGVINLPN